MVVGPTNGSQGQTMINIETSEAIKHPNWVRQLKIGIKLQIPYYQPLNEWLLEEIKHSKG